MLAASDYPLPAAFNTAYQRAQTVILETNLEALQTPKFNAKMANIMTFNDGNTLQASIKKETYGALKNYFNKNALPIDRFAHYTPLGITLMISLFEMQKMGMDSSLGVDQYFTNKAKQDDKTLGQLETPEEQLGFIANMATGKEDDIILKTLQEVDSIPAELAQMKTAWRSGNIAMLEKVGIEGMKKDYPSLYKTLLVERNNAWIPKIESMLATKHIEFILVGALHLAGDHGLIKQLNKKGYHVTYLEN